MEQQQDANFRPVLEQVFPANLSSIVKEIVRSISLHRDTHPGFNMTIEPEASIVNYCMVSGFDFSTV